jgi:hypothetical protein
VEDRDGGHYFFRVPNSLEGCDRWGEERGILYIKSLVVQWKDIRPGGPRSGLKGSLLFLKIVDFFYFWVSSQAAMGGRAAPRFVC